MESSLFILVSTSFLALCGAMAKLLSDIEHKKITKTSVIASASFAIFAGVIIGLLTWGLGNPAIFPYASAFSGLLGWVGKAAFDRWANRTVDAVADKSASIINAANPNSNQSS
jgi:hypothetical protein